MHPCTQPFRADALQGQPFGCPDSLLANPSNLLGFSAPMLSVAQIKRPPLRAAFLFVWRREGDFVTPKPRKAFQREPSPGMVPWMVPNYAIGQRGQPSTELHKPEPPARLAL